MVASVCVFNWIIVQCVLYTSVWMSTYTNVEVCDYVHTNPHMLTVHRQEGGRYNFTH